MQGAGKEALEVPLTESIQSTVSFSWVMTLSIIPGADDQWKTRMSISAQVSRYSGALPAVVDRPGLCE